MAPKKPDVNDLRLCIDRPIAQEAVMGASVLAMSENAENEPPPLVIPPGFVIGPHDIAIFTGKKWANGRKVGVKFLDGTKTQKAKTQKYAELWEKHANVNFDFAAGAKAEIRISFKERGSWSALGIDCLVTSAFPKSKPTMNYGWLKDDSDETEWRRVVIHEFGHALGAIHEHQNPDGGIQWNLKEVYRVFSGPPNNWTKAQIDFNIVQKYSLNQLNASKYDAKSIMLYAFPGSLIVGGVATQNNTDLSEQDKKFIAKLYPKTGAAPKVAGTPRLSVAAAPMAMAEAAPVAPAANVMEDFRRLSARLAQK